MLADDDDDDDDDDDALFGGSHRFPIPTRFCCIWISAIYMAVCRGEFSPTAAQKETKNAHDALKRSSRPLSHLFCLQNDRSGKPDRC
jgi:hypothetical protein